MKSETREWGFRYDPSDLGFGATIRENKTFEGLQGIVRTRYLLLDTTLLCMTYQYPDWMLVLYGWRTPPINILTDSDVHYFMSVRMNNLDLPIYATYGAEAVANYQFHCGSTFSVGGTSYLLPDSGPGLREEIPEYRGSTYPFDA